MPRSSVDRAEGFYPSSARVRILPGHPVPLPSSRTGEGWRLSQQPAKQSQHGDVCVIGNLPRLHRVRSRFESGLLHLYHQQHRSWTTSSWQRSCEKRRSPNYDSILCVLRGAVAPRQNRRTLLGSSTVERPAVNRVIMVRIHAEEPIAVSLWMAEGLITPHENGSNPFAAT